MESISKKIVDLEKKNIILKTDVFPFWKTDR